MRKKELVSDVETFYISMPFLPSINVLHACITPYSPFKWSNNNLIYAMTSLCTQLQTNKTNKQQESHFRMAVMDTKRDTRTSNTERKKKQRIDKLTLNKELIEFDNSMKENTPPKLTPAVRGYKYVWRANIIHLNGEHSSYMQTWLGGCFARVEMQLPTPCVGVDVILSYLSFFLCLIYSFICWNECLIRNREQRKEEEQQQKKMGEWLKRFAKVHVHELSGWENDGNENERAFISSL